MSVTFQFLIAEYLQGHGTKNTVALARIFQTDRNTMGATLRAMKSRDYVESDKEKPANWTLLKMPKPYGFTPHRERENNKKKVAPTGSHLNHFAGMPVVRL